MKICNLLALVCAFTVLSFSYSLAGFKYSGDGEFLDSGPLSGSNRYVLKLGNFDFKVYDNREFVVGDLPNTNTLGLYFFFRLGDGYKTLENGHLSCFHGIRVSISIASEPSGDILYSYDGLLFESGHRDGLYFREGLHPVSFSQAGNKYVGFTIPYDFDEKVRIFGVDTPFYKNLKRRIRLEVLGPTQLVNESECLQQVEMSAEIVISGGGWK